MYSIKNSQFESCLGLEIKVTRPYPARRNTGLLLSCIHESSLHIDIRYIILYIEVTFMSKVLISIPDQLALRMKVVIPSQQRSKLIARLIEKEVEKRERALYECAVAVEKDSALSRDMKEWDI